jgi:hypothetical protein
VEHLVGGLREEGDLPAETVGCGRGNRVGERDDAGGVDSSLWAVTRHGGAVVGTWARAPAVNACCARPPGSERRLLG